MIATLIGTVLAAVFVVGIFQDRSSSHSTPAFMLPLMLIFLLPLGVAFGGLYGTAVSKWLTSTKYSFSDAGFDVSVPSVTARFAWSEVKTSLQTSKYIVISVPSALQIIPIEGIDTETVRSLKNLLVQKVLRRER